MPSKTALKRLADCILRTETNKEFELRMAKGIAKVIYPHLAARIDAGLTPPHMGEPKTCPTFLDAAGAAIVTFKTPINKSP